MSIPKNHPYWLVKKIVLTESGIEHLNLSRYQYFPNTISDHREPIKISRENFLDENFMLAILENLKDQENIAFHSQVEMNNKTINHIPLIDMNTSAKAHLYKLKDYFRDGFYQQMTWYESGRSFHGYVNKLINFKEWTEFMGLLLLCNQKNMTPTVDPRWIGHRLLAGYAALRWTKNGPHYLAMPSAIE